MERKKIIIGNKKTKNATRKKIPNGPLMKWNNNKFVKRHFRKARRSKTPNKHLFSAKHRKPKVMKEQKEDEMYSEVKRKAPRTKSIELFPRLRRNKEQVRKRKVLDRRANSSSKALERTGLSIPVSPNGDKHQELVHSGDGEMFSEEETISTIKNELRRLHIHDETNTNKENVEAFSTVVTTTFDGLKESVFLTHATTTRSEIVSQQESVLSKELQKSNNESESSTFSLEATTVMTVIPPTSTQNEIMSTKVTPYMNEVRGDDDTLEKTANGPITLSWVKRVLEPKEALPLPTAISLDPWIKTNLELQPTEIGSGIVNDQIKILLPNNSALHVESSGGSHVEVELVHRNGTLQMTESTYVQSTERSSLPYPTDHKDGNITNTVADVSEEIHDNVFSPLEMVMNYGSETTYCKPGYKYYAGACKSMCNMEDFYCENGGQCVIVENLGAMCRCHQTSSLCYRGECCRLSLTPLQLICVIGSCCIFVSVFLGSISLLIRRMDIKAVSKSVRTRLWISTLMPSSRSSSFSNSVASEFTACSEYGSSDPSSFTHNKEVTYEGGTLKCERTRL